jgi:hypothetical protein
VGRRPSKSSWREPDPGETNHREILPFEAETRLLLPNMEGTLYVLGESGAEIENKPLGFYREEFYHYVNNFSTPRSGTYTLGAELNPLRYNRHEVDGEWKIFTEPLTVEFGNVEIDTEGGT